MKKTDLSKIREDIVKFVEDWKYKLFINHWSIRILYRDKLKSKDTFAYVERNGKYNRADIFVSLEHLKNYIEDGNRELIFQSILHELVHIVLNDYDDMVECIWKTESEYDQVRERTTESLAWILYNAYPNKFAKPKKKR